ncbi:MoxR family ATPase [Streptomyces naganishii]|uniref:ATPase AAA n=1 Tax=Streptomyces naganishii JCM 4654 TaxID=1306179 RepID=A0A918Y3D2_9ACTN|nr:MoxR family ATPase [Streptomyces naganishii]GHD89697.1 ATPase AAA [Streptomyces naganishii JCM 4654]
MADRGLHDPSAADGTVADPGAWHIYQGTGRPPEGAPLIGQLPPPPPWRRFAGAPLITEPAPRDDAEFTRRLGPADDAVKRSASTQEKDMVNAALFLRRPLIVAGPPGIGKSSLAHCVSRELGLGRVLRWSITSRTTLKDGLYAYDAIGRVQEAAARGAWRGSAAGTALSTSGPTDADADASPDAGPEADATPDAETTPHADAADAPDHRADRPLPEPDGTQELGAYIQLGPLGTALLPRPEPRVLLIDEFDKADMDLAGDLLSVFEEGEYRIPELARVRSRMPDVEVHTDDPDGTAVIHHGLVRCAAFPVVVITTNGERVLPPAFLRRCLYLELPPPDAGQLAAMLAAHLSEGDAGRATLIRDFLARSRTTGTLAADQLLASEFLRTTPAGPDENSWNGLLHSLWRRLDGVGSG